MRGFDHFRIIAPIYERVFVPDQDREWKNLLDLPVNGRVLDVGGGTGRIAQFLAPYADQVVINDVSIHMLIQANKKDGLFPVCSYGESLPFTDESFDRVLMVDALHHVVDQGEVADELWRVLKPGGCILIEEPDIRTLMVKGIALGEKLLGMRSHFLNPGQIEALFKKTYAVVNTKVNGQIAYVSVHKDERLANNK